LAAISRRTRGQAPRHERNSRFTLRRVTNPRERGRAAEQRAAEHLQAQGLIVLARNLRCRAGELDLVGLDGEVLAVVEIRQRSRIDFGGAPGSVTQRKQRKIIRAVRFFMTREPAWRGLRLRFDVVSIEGAQRITWIKDAFRAT
jgi:putative endonuclease